MFFYRTHFYIISESDKKSKQVNEKNNYEILIKNI